MNNKEEILNLLSKGNVRITFIKKDGSERTLTAIPYNKVPQEPDDGKVKRTRKAYPENILAVYDEQDGWRSFDVNSVTNYEAV